MTSPNPAPMLAPVRSEARINALDVIRGVALLGILLMNIHGMGLPYGYFDPGVSGGSEGMNLYVWIMNEMLFEGTMRGLFTMLFGASIILLTSRLEKNGAGINTADIYYRRLTWLLLFGVIHAYLILWDGEILFPYAVLGMLLFPWRNMNPKGLLTAGIVLLILGTLWSARDYQNTLKIQKKGLAAEAIKLQGDSLTVEQTKALEKWEEKKKRKTQEEADEWTEKMHKGYWSIVMDKVSVNQNMQTFILYRYFFWDLLGFMFIGMALFKWKIFHGQRKAKVYLWMLLLGYGIGLTVNYFETVAKIESEWDVVIRYRSSLTYDLGRLATTIGHIGLIMLFIKSGILQFLQHALASVGKMALSNYVMHSIITAIIFLGFGFSMFGQLQRFELYYVVLGIWIFQLIASPIWLKYYRYGPLEWLWRSLTYWKKQPFKIK